MSDSYSFEDELLDRLEQEEAPREKRRRRSSAHLRIAFTGEIPNLPDASCKEYPEPLWDLEIDKESRHERAARHYSAKTICSTCPMQRPCQQWAAERQATDDDVRGVWGGRVFAPDTVSYPRCEICDIALSLSLSPRYRAKVGYAPRSTHTDNLEENYCVRCAEVAGLVEYPTPEDGEPGETDDLGSVVEHRAE